VTWLPPDAGEATVSLDEFATGRAGATIGRVSVPSPDGPVSAPLVLDQPITDPGPGWRLLNPVPVITALIESR
jgi:D-alanyl-D-alanine carboxypeptidase (penicillin-binding protein 5/6)